MTPEQALQILDMMSQIANAPRRDHASAIEALKVLKEFIDSKKGTIESES